MTDKLLNADIWTEKVYDGNWVAGAGPVWEAKEPGSNNTIGTVGMASSKQINDGIHGAKDAQVNWVSAGYEERASIMRNAASVMEEHASELTEMLMRESGSIRAKAEFEVSLSIKALRESAAIPSQAKGEVLPSATGKLSFSRRRPIGIVGVISPFNFPLYLAMRAVAPALATGNAVVLKPDPRTAICGGVGIARVLEKAGVPKGLFQMFPGDGAVGAALVENTNIGMIQFTGSTLAGKKVGEAASRNLKKVSLELGGKNSLIILNDADLDLALANATWGTYLHQGQICMSTGRILVHRSLYTQFISKLAKKAKTLVAGDPMSEKVALGPLINEKQRDNVKRIVDEAIAAGATLEAGGNFDNLYFEATVLSQVDKENPAFNEEIFGPVAVVVPFDDDEDAVSLANDTEYGLSVGIISGDIGRAMKLSEKLNTGLLHINDQTVNDEVVNPFGGTGASGNGTSIGGAANWEEFTQWQWVTIQPEAPQYPL